MTTPRLRRACLVLWMFVACAPPAAPDDDAGAAPDAGEVDPDGWPADWIENERAMQALVDGLRTQGGDCPSGARAPTAPFVVDTHLRTAARLHSRDMGERGYFDHFSPEGDGPPDRMIEAGYDGQPGGENIAGGAATADEAFALWMSSDGHCRNMTASQFNEIGIGYAFVEGSPLGHYWTQTFGAR